MAVNSMTPDLQVGGEVRLRRNTLSLSHIVAFTLINIAPVMSFFFGFAVIVRGAGLAGRIGAYVADQ